MDGSDRVVQGTWIVNDIRRYTANDDQLVEEVSLRRVGGTCPGDQMLDLTPAGGIHGGLLVEQSGGEIIQEPMDEPAEVDDQIVDLGMAATVLWSTLKLAFAHALRRRRPGAYAHAVEPANCGVRGSAVDRAVGQAPVALPGESRGTRLTILLEHK